MSLVAAASRVPMVHCVAETALYWPPRIISLSVEHNQSVGISLKQAKFNRQQIDSGKLALEVAICRPEAGQRETSVRNGPLQNHLAPGSWHWIVAHIATAIEARCGSLAAPSERPIVDKWRNCFLAV